MLHEFITTNRDEIITRCREKISSAPAPRPTDAELEHGVPLFLDQVASTLRLMLEGNPAIAATATKHGHELLQRGFTIAQVVRDYGGVCQAITELAVETNAPITPQEFQTLNLCLDDAIAGAVTEYGRLRAHEGSERLGYAAHELRNLLNSAFLAFMRSRAVVSASAGARGRSFIAACSVCATWSIVSSPRCASTSACTTSRRYGCVTSSRTSRSPLPWRRMRGSSSSL